MTEPKRRGRPPKAATALVEGADVPEKDAPEPVIAAPVMADASPAQRLASRIWAGQSVDSIGHGERIRRITVALAAQGMTMDGVVLP